MSNNPSSPTPHTDPDARDVVADQATEVGQTASQEASRMGDQAASSAKAVAEEARTQLQGITDVAVDQVRDQADVQVQRAGDGLRQTGERLRALAEGNPDDAGPLGGYASTAASMVSGWADHLEQRGIEELLGDVSDFARRKPGQFLTAALVAGVVAGRVGRNVQAADIDMPPSPGGKKPDNSASDQSDDPQMPDESAGSNLPEQSSRSAPGGPARIQDSAELSTDQDLDQEALPPPTGAATGQRGRS